MNFKTVGQFGAELDGFRSKVSRLKQNLMTGSVMGQEGLNSLELDAFKITLKDFLQSIKLYGDDINRTIRSIQTPSSPERLKTIPYELIKEFVFANPDYNSIGGFTAGLIRGSAEDGQLVKPSDVDDFFTHTVELAFRYNVLSTGELIEKCQFIIDSVEPMTMLSLKLFDSVVSYPDLFKVSDLSSIYTSSIKAIRAIDAYLRSHADSDNKSRLRDIAILHNFCEYLNFTVTAYYARTFMIGYYIAPVWYQTTKILSPMSESAKEIAIQQTGCRFEPLAKLDSTTVTDYKTLNKYMNVFRQLVSWINYGTLKDADKNPINSIKVEKVSKKVVADNGPSDDADENIERFINSSKVDKAFKKIVADNGLSDNVLITQVIISFNSDLYAEERDEIPQNTTEVYHILKSSVTNSQQALQLKSSAKNDILKAITSVSTVKNLASLRSAANDALILVGVILFKLRDRRRLYEVRMMDYGDVSTISNRKLLSECHMMILELYRAIALAGYEKACLLEKLYRHYTDKQTDELLTSTEINVKELMDSSTTQFPDTMRISDDILSLHERPIMEYLSLRNEYLSSQFGLGDDLYLIESSVGVNFNKIVDKLVMFLEELVTYFASFVKRFGPAAHWVERNKTLLTSTKLTDDDKLEGIKQYKVKSHDGLIKGLKLDQIKANITKPLDEFTLSLYPSKEIHDAFKADKKLAAIRYSNNYLFGVTSDKEVPTVTMSGNDLSKALSEWVNDITNYEDIMKRVDETNKELKEVIKFLRTNSDKAETTQSKPATNQGNSTEPPELKADENTPGGGNSGNTKPANEKSNDKTESAGDGDRTAKVVRVQNAINNLWKPIYNGTIRTLQDEYGYIRKAYHILVAKDKENTSTDTTASSNDKDGV